MGNVGIRWLLQELPELVRRGVISEETAERLRAHYGEPGAGLAPARLALIVFGALGSALIGGGIVLLLAHNWDDLSRPVRAAISIGILVGAQALVAWVIARRRHSTAWSEGAGAFLVIAVGASIALISQTYHIGGGLSDYLLTVSLLTLPVMYLLDARLPALIYWLAISNWAHVASDADSSRGWYWLLAAAAVPYLWTLARRPHKEWRLLGLAVAIGLLIAGGRSLAGVGGGGLWIIYTSGILAAYLAIGTRRDPAPSWTGPFTLFGAAGVPFVSLLLTFRWPWERLVAVDTRPLAQPDPLIALGVGAGAGLFALQVSLRLLREGRWHLALPSAALLPAALGYALSMGGGGTAAVVLFDLYLLAIGLTTLFAGFRAGSMGVANLGLLAVAALATARFFDADISFVARGVGFIVVGAILLGVNLFLIRRKKEAPA